MEARIRCPRFHRLRCHRPGAALGSLGWLLGLDSACRLGGRRWAGAVRGATVRRSGTADLVD